MRTDKGTNKIKIQGFVTDLQFSHKNKGGSYWSGTINSVRSSGTTDKVPVVIPEELMQKDFSKCVCIRGHYRSRNTGEDKRTLQLFVLASEITEMEETEYDNYVILQGFLCKPPICRETGSGRKIADLLVAVNSKSGFSNYFPCICWEKYYELAEQLKIGDELIIHGRVQSREYKKVLDDGTEEMRIAYEVSADRLEKINDAKVV